MVCYVPSLSNSVLSETMLILEINHGEHYYFWHVNKYFVLCLANTEFSIFFYTMYSQKLQS